MAMVGALAKFTNSIEMNKNFKARDLELRHVTGSGADNLTEIGLYVYVL